jgi:hypothetical protein
MNALKTKAHNLIDALPDEKMDKVLVILEGLKDIIADNVPDHWDLQLIRKALEAEKTGEFISLDNVAKELGFDVDKLQNNH